ncbi:LysR family transcriptional regulator [Clostridium sp. AM58-1XD]|uniref:LysR family transcriptional regulator n=1 Tax=Clostridium sp. AM58-1XD TaxID=2292307 RepID=UPI000E505327|nr:LysR family transcriptional regulator [Clostridium sp. AM58-1XD]RGY98092.1 LysR family transcriptional regulator [Clostridium sp. AM58-1XD]
MKDTDWQILNALYLYKNITKAANSLFITQPAITKRLQVIEEEYHVKIVNRSIKGVEFTPEGTYLAAQAERYLLFFEETKKGLEQIKNEEYGKLRIGVVYSYSKYCFSEILAEYMKCHNKVQVEVVNDHSDKLIHMVCEGKIDVALLKGDYGGNVERILIMQEQGYIMSKTPCTMNELPQLPRVDYDMNASTKKLVRRWWEEYFKEPYRVGIRAEFIDHVWQLAEKGLGYCLCFWPGDDLDRIPLYKLPMVNRDGTLVTRNLWMVYPKEALERTCANGFIHFMNEYYERKKKRIIT